MGGRGTAMTSGPDKKRENHRQRASPSVWRENRYGVEADGDRKKIGRQKSTVDRRTINPPPTGSGGHPGRARNLGGWAAIGAIAPSLPKTVLSHCVDCVSNNDKIK